MSGTMTLEELLRAAGVEDAGPPDAFLGVLENVQVHANPPGLAGFLATWQGSVGSEGSRIDVLAFRTGSDTDPSDPLPNVTVFVADVRVEIDGVRFPLVNLPGEAFKLSRVQFLFVSRALDLEDVREVNRRIFRYEVGDLPQLPVPVVSEGFLWGWMGALSFDTGGTQTPALIVRYGAQDGTWSPPPGPAPSTGQPPDQAGAVVDKAWGPVRLSRVGLGISGGELLVTVDVQITTGPLVWEVAGLGFSLSLDGEWRFGFPLYGASLAYRESAPIRVEITGALRRTDIGDDEVVIALAGLGRIEAENILVVQAAGAYSRNRAGWTSVFGYAEVLRGENFPAAPWGWPPYFVVTGFSLGLGINSTVRVPTVTDVGSFPLVQRLDAAPTSPIDPEPPPLGVLQAVNLLAGQGGWIRPAQGQYWGAGGVQFTIFNYLNARVLVLVEGGQEWKVMLIGATTVTFPKGAAKPVGRINLALAIAYQVSKQLFTMDVAVGPGSYLLDERALLTGGISLHVDGRTGEFAVSLGGYHPQYQRPGHYPTPPRIGAIFQLSNAVTIKGEAYLAVVSNAMMFGGALAVLYDKGGTIKLQAWFTARIDVLVQWKPFYFDAYLGVRIGVAATVKVAFIRVRVSVEVGVDVALWGPPIGGQVSVKLWFVSLNFAFGSDRRGAPPVPWSEYRNQLPAPLKVEPQQGLETGAYRPVEGNGARRVRTGEADAPLLVSNTGFVFTTQAAISTNRITLNGQTVAEDPEKTRIRPMKLANVDSTHEVTLTHNGAPFGVAELEEYGWQMTETRQDLPRSLWGEPLAKPGDALTEKPETVRNRLVGLRFEVLPPIRGDAVGPVTSRALDVDGLPDGFMPLRSGDATGPCAVRNDDSVAVIGRTIADSAVEDERAALHQALLDWGAALDPAADESLRGYAAEVDALFTTAPLTTPPLTTAPLTIAARR